MNYTLDPYSKPGVVVVMVENHQSYLAENFHQAETFVQRLACDAPIALPAPSDAEALIARVLDRLTSAPPVS